MTTENTGDATLNGGEQSNSTTVDSAASELESVRAEHAKLIKERDEWKGKARKFEQAANSASQWQKQVEDLTVDKSNLYNELTGLKTSIRDEKTTLQLTTALEAAGARDVKGAMKLIDRSKVEFGDDGNVKQDSIVGLVNELKGSDPWAFKTEQEIPEKKSTSSTSTTVKPPTVKDAAQTASASAFATELRSCKTQQEVDAVMKKYGK